MGSCPPVGKDFAEIRLDGYTNINEIFPQCDRLHGTETLCGDWSGTTLVLGQDFANAMLIRKRLERRSGENPYWNDPKNRTNRNLCEFLNPKHNVSIYGTTRKSCDVLYANVVWLLKPGAGLNGALPNRNEALGCSRPVLEATIKCMPNLCIILCLGQVAYEGMTEFFGERRVWRDDLERRSPLIDRGIMICPMSHPGTLGILGRKRNASWQEKRGTVAEDFRFYLETLC